VTGANGANGATGATGSTGATGATGATGTISSYERRTSAGTAVTYGGTSSATATCSTGFKVVGGGYTVTGLSGAGILVSVLESAAIADNQWRATLIFSLYGDPGSGTLTANAVCLQIP
jgi:hypothetical protein